MLIGSLTTYDLRINTVELTINSLLNQSVRLDRIVLWLDCDEFSPVTLPAGLQRLQAQGLIETNYCPNIKSYKKLIPSLRKYPDDTIIVFDDDIIYEHDLVERLLNTSKRFPKAIVAARARKIKHFFGFLTAYKQWPIARRMVVGSRSLFPTTGGGTLFPPHSLAEEVFNEKAFMRLAPHGDDIWFYAMARLARTPIVNTPYFVHENVIDSAQSISLFACNSGGNYDKQIKAVFDYYHIK